MSGYHSGPQVDGWQTNAGRCDNRLVWRFQLPDSFFDGSLQDGFMEMMPFQSTGLPILYVIASWPMIYVTWEEAVKFCASQGKRLPSEAEWEKAARGTDGHLFPWGRRRPEPGLAVFGQYHVHEIPLMAAVNSGEEGRSPYGLRHMAGNVAEWVYDWFMFDYYTIMPDRNPRGPASGRYKGVRGGSWKSRPNLLRTATRNGASPEQRLSTIGFRCAGSAPVRLLPHGR